ncbi:hypothetical protein ACIGB6_14475 [Paeniglutamicibacter gangotriensis]|uniref:hypothetical protein n=1 Tax=Paeniglutamicibacter gangotriensis TaxID=254787 RepID=UPI0037CABDD7
MNETSMPTEVWHYTDANGLLGMVRDRSIWAGCTDFMNDEKEAIKGIELLRSRWGARGTEASSNEEREEIERLIASMESSKSRQYIVSASEQSDSLTLWRNYGREAVSYAVRLDPSVKLVPVPLSKYWDKNDWPDAPPDYLDPYIQEYEDSSGQLQQVLSEYPDMVHSRQRDGWKKVEYIDANQVAIVDNVAKEILTPRVEKKQGLASLFETVILEMLWEEQLTLIKDRGFHHEEEVRLHVYAISPEWRFVHYRATALGVTPYIVLTEAVDQTEGDYRFGSVIFEKKPRKLPILAIRISPTRYPELAEKGLRNILDENGYTNVEILKSEVPFR